MARLVIVIAVLVAATLAGCERERNTSPVARQEGPVEGDFVARVGERSIGASDVAVRMAAEDLGAETALRQLVDEALLVGEAERLGFSEARDDERGVERLMVRTMLHELEAKNTPESITQEEVREVYALHASQFRVPEHRRSWHILVEAGSVAAEALAKSILTQIRRAEDPRTVFDRYADGGPDGLEFEVKAEDLPAITEQAGMKKAYIDALFAAESEGPLKNVVKTSYGWHAIVVAEILPEEVRTVDEAEEEIREQLSQRKRFGQIFAIVQGLEAQGLVHYDEQGVDLLLSMPGLPEHSE